MTEQTAPIVVEGLPQTKEDLAAKLKDLDRPLTVEELRETLGSTIKYDNNNKVISFLTMLMTYTEADQINVGFLAASSTGKSYIPIELSWYFPDNDIIKLGYVSPTAFFHEWGKMEQDPTDETKKIIHVNLHQKILIFLDQPHSELLQRMRALLSHDEKTITVKITDRQQKGGYRTKTVIIEGFPTVIFCAAKFTLDDQEKTRLLMLSPEATKEKIEAAINLKIEKEGDRALFNEKMASDPNRVFLQNRVDKVKTTHIQYVNIPSELQEAIRQRFFEAHKVLRPRNQRDISRLLTVIKGHALLNYMDRTREANTITVNQADIEAGWQLYSTISQANERGLSPELWTIYEKVKPCMEAENGIALKDFQKCYYEHYNEFIGSKKATDILKAFELVGLVAEFPDPNDRRVIRYIPPGVWVKQQDSIDNSINNVNNNEEKITLTPQGIYLPTSCWVCKKPFLEDLADTTVDQGRTIHLKCYQELKAGRKNV